MNERTKSKIIKLMFSILIIITIGLIILYLFNTLKENTKETLDTTEKNVENINSAKEESIKLNVYSYVDLFEKYLALSNTGISEYTPLSPNTTCDLEKLSTECESFINKLNETLKGEKPITGKITINEDGSISATGITFSSYPNAKWNYDGETVTKQ